MSTIRLPVSKEWDIYSDRESLFVELDLEQLRDFIEKVIHENKCNTEYVEK